jgi:arylsulfatase A-like enzyme
VQPNVLLIFADQLRADALGCYGSTVVRTPAIDRLAERATVFDAAYTPSPVCVPARAALLTGREPQANGCYENGSPMPDARTFLDELGDAGYRTHGVGKMHFTPDAQALRGFQTRDRGEEFSTPEDDDYLTFLAENGFGHVELPHGLRDEMYYVPQLSPVPEWLHFSHWVADRSLDFLASTGDQPFLLWSSFVAPHPPFAPPSPWHRLYEPSLMPDPHEPAGGPGLLTVYDRLQARYKYRDGGRDRRLWQLLRAYYAASVSFLDSQIGRILTALEASGKLEDTLVVLSADHGEFLGDYGTFGKRSFLNPAARIPLVCAGPDFAAGRSSAPVSLIDLYPTFAVAAGLPTPAVDGVALQSVPSGRAVFGQYQQGPIGLFAVITERWKYIWSAPDRREYLLDRVRDPQETANLAYNVRVRAQLLELRALARKHFTDLADTDFDRESSNVPLLLGNPPDPDVLRSLRALSLDRDASTLVVGGGEWVSPPEGYGSR